MKRLLTLCLMLTAMLAASAQTTTRYGVRYVKEHLLCEDGDEVNVVDIDMEWPEAMDGADMRPLQAFLVKHLFGSNGYDFDTAYAAFTRSFGKPVSRQFPTLPDDSKVCYAAISLQMVGRTPGRYAAFELTGEVRPAKRSSHVASSVSMLVTYDLVGLAVLRRDDLLRHDRLENQFDAFDVLLPGYTDDNTLANLAIDDACLVDGRLLLRNSLTDLSGNDLEYKVMVEPSDLSRYLSKTAKALLKPGKAAVTPFDAETTATLDGEPVCKNPDEKPQFQVPGRSLGEYLSSEVRSVRSDIDGSRAGQVLVLLTIDKSGETRDVRICQPLAPAYDREAVRVVRSLPRWKPATKDGEPVATQVVIGIEFVTASSDGAE